MATMNDNYRKLSQMDRGTSFLANVILTSCRYRGRMLRNLLARVEAGQEVQMCSNTMDYVRIDGDAYPLSHLLEKF